MGQWPMAHQRLLGVRKDHSLGVAVALDLFPEVFSLLDPPSSRR